VMGLGAIGILMLFRWWRKRRRLAAMAARKEPYSAPSPALLEIARQFTLVLQRQNASCPPNRTWAEHLHALRAETGESARDRWREAMDFIAQYNRVRFRTPDDTQAIRELQEKLRKLK